MIKLRKIKTKYINREYTNEDKTKKIKLPCFSYDLDIFGVKILIIISTKNLNKHNKLFGRGACEVKCCDYLDTHKELNIFFRDNPSINTITHECVHACDFILSYLHHKHPNNANELNANLTAHLVDVVLKAKQ